MLNIKIIISGLDGTHRLGCVIIYYTFYNIYYTYTYCILYILYYI